jgi:glyoxylase-like metal-dependent hydrolase (beta-lactamase superfamily II)
MVVAALAVPVALCATLLGPPARAQSVAGGWTASMQDIRRVAGLIPGRRPLRLNMLTFAESRRTKNFAVKGAPADPSVQARTAFQVMYSDGSVMVDAGMSLAVHSFFGRGVDEPYYPDAAEQVNRALADAKLIVVTHEHGDHVAGVIDSSLADQLAPKTLLTRAQVDRLIASPQMPEIALTADRARRFVVVDYDSYFPLAPGIALVKAAGHTPGSQMVYIGLESGREYLLIGDATWHMDGVREMVGKDAPWVTEDAEAVLDQLRWLNGLSRTDPDLVVVASHDREQHEALIQQGVLAHRLE